VLDAIATSSTIPSISIQSMREYDLGAIDGVPLGFSDAAALPDGSIVFSAIAENAANAFDDGAFTGAAIGIIATDGTVSRWMRVREPAKIEGICAEAHRDTVRLLVVTDADDARIPAVLYGATFTLGSSESAR
jgi:hypothetical protein